MAVVVRVAGDGFRTFKKASITINSVPDVPKPFFNCLK
jgi:hypothetical protein